MTSLTLAVLLCVWLDVYNSEVLFIPEMSSALAFGVLTSRTMILKQPLCYFDQVEGLPCSVHQCEIWLVVARGEGVQLFENQETSTDILSQSPYPDAFLSNTSPNFFITRVGVQSSFPCAVLPGLRYFQVGAEGICDATNCNGVLPTGATIRVKYILVDPAQKRVESGTLWSQPINLLTPQDSSSIDVHTWKRSGAMVVITVILSCSLAVLTLLLVVILVRGSSGLTPRSPASPEPPSLSHGIRGYNTHNFKNSRTPEYSRNI